MDQNNGDFLKTVRDIWHDSITVEAPAQSADKVAMYLDSFFLASYRRGAVQTRMRTGTNYGQVKPKPDFVDSTAQEVEDFNDVIDKYVDKQKLLNPAPRQVLLPRRPVP